MVPGKLWIFSLIKLLSEVLRKTTAIVPIIMNKNSKVYSIERRRMTNQLRFSYVLCTRFKPFEIA